VRIGIDARPALYSRSGIGVYVRELVPALARTFPQDTIEGYGHRLRRRSTRLAVEAWPGNARLHDRPWPATFSAVLARWGFGVDRLLGGADVLHATDYVAFPSERTPLVATIHDVLFETLPQCYTRKMRHGLRFTTNAAVARARRLIVPCERVKQDLVRFFPVDPARVHVVPHGTPRPPPGPPATGKGRYVLALGTLEPRKNLVRLLEAFDAVRQVEGDVRVVVVGARGWLDEPILAAIAARPWVEHLGAVGPAELAGLLRGASVLAYPSLGEGFGLPVLEGFAAGVPVLVGADTACSDLAGDAALAVDPRDGKALGAGLLRLLGEAPLRAALVARGRAVAAVHTWERAARLTRAVYELALHA
jgi:glycosyltransferase involved in cell wall biosynthesis